jgi:hypothetical protein
MATIPWIKTPHEIIEDSGVMEGRFGREAFMLLMCSPSDVGRLTDDLLGWRGHRDWGKPSADPCLYPGAYGMSCTHLRQNRPVGLRQEDRFDLEKLAAAEAKAKQHIIEAGFNGTIGVVDDPRI